MFNQIKTTLSSEEFQRKATKVAGGVVSIVLTAVISNLVSTAVDAAGNALMDKIHGKTEVVTAE